MFKKRDNKVPEHEATKAALDSAMETLGFYVIRQSVAGLTQTPVSRQLALEMKPSYCTNGVERLQLETAEGVLFLDSGGDKDLRPTEDVSKLVDRASLDGSLVGKELLSVANALDAQRSMKSQFIARRNNVPILSEMADGITDLLELQRHIEDFIDDNGEVLDRASSKLARIRQKTREAYATVTEALQRIINSLTIQGVLQEQVVSIRGDRLVIQVKVEHRRKVPGIVHDASNTGATLYVEPLVVVDLCNEWRELVLDEHRQTARILSDLSELVGNVAHEIKLGNGLVAQLDLILARARYSKSINGVSPQRPEGTNRELKLIGARHPLIKDEAIPISMHIGPEWSVLVITGPNTGGKTVAMKLVGLIALMHQSGLYIPTEEGSMLPVFDGIYADIGDRQSIVESVSTFGSHINNLINIIDLATSASLVLLDELGSSTDPEEGAALAKAILSYLVDGNKFVVVTTHHLSLAAYAEMSTGMTNASVALDEKELRPTYQITMGLPGRSYAMKIADNLGLPKSIMADARAMMDTQHAKLEDWLEELQRGSRELEERLQEAENSRLNARSIESEIESQMEQLSLASKDILDNIRTDLESQAQDVKKKLRRMKTMMSLGNSDEEVQVVRDELVQARKDIENLSTPLDRNLKLPDSPALEVGDVVEIRGLNARGEVLSTFGHDGEVEVAVGAVRFVVGLDRLSPAKDSARESVSHSELILSGFNPSVSELDIRGYRVDAAILEVEQFLDRSLRDGLSLVRIIHGKGTGALREAIRNYLEHNPLTKSFTSGSPENGGEGVTCVELL